MGTSTRGFASMSEDQLKITSSKGGHMSGGNFANNPKRASEAGKKGAAAQPIEAKARGGRNSHRS